MKHLTIDQVSWATEIIDHLENGELHLWRLELDQNQELQRHLYDLLSNDEKERASKFRFEKDRIHFVVGRGSLRVLIHHYLGRDISISFNYSPFGKPCIASQDHIHFNVSHSAGQMLLAFSKEQTGVDVEFVNHAIDVEKLADRFFSKGESEFVRSLGLEEQSEYFFRCWTRKESFIKAHGKGMSLPLDSFEFTLDHKDDVRLKQISLPGERAENWQSISFEPRHQYLAAATVRGVIGNVSFFELELSRFLS